MAASRPSRYRLNPGARPKTNRQLRRGLKKFRRSINKPLGSGHRLGLSVTLGSKGVPTPKQPRVAHLATFSSRGIPARTAYGAGGASHNFHLRLGSSKGRAPKLDRHILRKPRV